MYQEEVDFMDKRNGVFHARLVTYGYSQVPGVDFNESFAPVINHVNVKILLIAQLVWKMKYTIIDIETDFLHGKLDEEIYMDIPSGLNVDSNKKLISQKIIYGLV